MERPFLIYDQQTVFKIKEKPDDLAELLRQADQMLLESLYPESYCDSSLEQFSQDGMRMDKSHGIDRGNFTKWNSRYHDPGNQLCRFAEVLGTAYCVTGKEKYADALKKAMLYYAKYGSWVGPECKVKDPTWQSELNTGRFIYGYALGADAIAPVLTTEEWIVITDTVWNKGIACILHDWLDPLTRIHALDSMGHNWWAVLVSAAGLGIVAFWESYPQAERILTMVRSALNEF